MEDSDQDSITIRQLNGKYLINSEYNKLNDGVSELDSSVVDTDDPLEGFHDAITINEQYEKPSYKRPKYNLKMILSYSSKYIKSFNKFGEQLYENHSPRTINTDKSSKTNLCDDKLSDLIKDYTLNECKFTISLSDTVIKQIKRLNYLPKIEHQSKEYILPVQNSNKQINLVQWNQINETNLRCLVWLKDHRTK